MRSADGRRIVVVGAGVGGLTTAALLARSGYQVTVLEAHVYAGGCAGTFYHKGYRFDSGATLAGGFSGGGPHAQVAAALDLQWPVSPVDPAWVVHLPGRTVTQWADAERWRAESEAAFPGSAGFWRAQEQLADVSWDIASRPFPWPPESARDLFTVAAALRPRTLLALPHLLRTVAQLASAHGASTELRTFLDAQLLIAAQTVSRNAHALYGSAALDLPRRGVNHVHGGIGALATTLADWLRANGGEVLYRQTVEKIEVRSGSAVAVHTSQGLRVPCDYLVANLTPWSLRELLGAQAPAALTREVQRRPATWGAFTLYLGLDAQALPAGLADHHQVVVDASQPLGEGNSVFVSLSAAGDARRAPAGMRAATLSTHTAIAPWWQLHNAGGSAYADRKAAYTAQLLAAAERAVPGIGRATRLCLAGTPLTFEFYTGRAQGMVGGFAQTSLFNVRGPHTGLANAWLVGDSVFPGQSTAGVTLGGMRVARAVMTAAGPATRQLPQSKQTAASLHATSAQ